MTLEEYNSSEEIFDAVFSVTPCTMLSLCSEAGDGLNIHISLLRIGGM